MRVRDIRFGYRLGDRALRSDPYTFPAQKGFPVLVAVMDLAVCGVLEALHTLDARFCTEALENATAACELFQTQGVAVAPAVELHDGIRKHVSGRCHQPWTCSGSVQGQTSSIEPRLRSLK